MAMARLRERPLRPLVYPLQKPLVRWVLQLLGGFMLLWLAVFLILNDKRLALLINTVVSGTEGKPNSGQVRGTFRLGYAHYDYWSSLASVILNTTAPVRGGNYDLLDPDGNLVMHINEVRADVYMGELVRGLLKTAFYAPLKKGVFIDLHFTRARIYGGHGSIRATASSMRDHPEKPEVNIVAAMASKRPSAKAGPGRLLILVDGVGVEFQDLALELDFPAWYGAASGMRGTATLRFSSLAGENWDGRPAFVYDVRPLFAEKGHVSIGGKGKPGSFAFDLYQLDLQRFGARASESRNLLFRGKALAEGNARLEMSGGLIDTYCDTGVDLTMLVEHAGALARRATSDLLAGQPTAKLRIYGPFSEKEPQSPCMHPKRPDDLPDRRPKVPLPRGKRMVLIEGQAQHAEGQVAGIPFAKGTSHFELVGTTLTLPNVKAQALSGEVKATPLQIQFRSPLSFSAVVKAQGTDPGQLKALPPSLRKILTGKLSGGVKITGGFAAQKDPTDDKAHIDRVRFSGIDVDLDRKGGWGPLPRQIEMKGDVVYTEEAVSLSKVDLQGDGVHVVLPRGAIGIPSGRLRLDEVALTSGPQAVRFLEPVGVKGLRSVAAKMKVLGTLASPELSQGVLTLEGLDVLGRKVEEVKTNFDLKGGTLSVEGLAASGLLSAPGSLTAEGSLQIFSKGRGFSLNPDPALQASIALSRLSMAELVGLPGYTGDLFSEIELGGTLYRPTGTARIKAPSLLIHGSSLRDLLVEVEMKRESWLLTSLYTLFGQGGILNGSASLGRDGEMPLSLSLNPHRLRLQDIPWLSKSGFQFAGEVSGGLRIVGPLSPHKPALDGRLSLSDFVVKGPPLTGPTLPTLSDLVSKGETNPAFDLASDLEAQPMFRLLGASVRTLVLGGAELAFRPDLKDHATEFQGTLFEAFRVKGRVYLEPADPRGEITLSFGCPSWELGQKPQPPSGPVDCDLDLLRMFPEIKQVADADLKISGDLQIRFGRGFQATLALSRAALSIAAVDDEGQKSRYLVRNLGEIVVSTDLETLRVQKARLLAERPRKNGPPESMGTLSVAGFLGKDESDLLAQGQIGLQVVEHLLRATFRKMAGQIAVDLHIRGRRGALYPEGAITLSKTELYAQDMDMPIQIAGAEVLLSKDRVTVKRFSAEVHKAIAKMTGGVEVRSWSPLEFGRLQLFVDGALSGRVLQWRLARFLSEGEGELQLRGLRISGTVESPQLEGVVAAKELALSVRKFHEVRIHRGTLRFVGNGAEAGDGGQRGGSLVLGCGLTSEGGFSGDRYSGCQQVSATVDGDGKATLAGRVVHTGLGALLRPDWHRMLSKVDLEVGLTNVRHTSQGAYTVEVTTAAPLRLYGSWDNLRLSGRVDLVSGRYIQPFRLSDRFLRKDVEEEVPFWQGDPLLEPLQLDLGVTTRGNFQVDNNIAEMRLMTTDLTLSGRLADLRMGGTIRVDSGVLSIPGLRGAFRVKGDSKMEFSSSGPWQETTWVDVRGHNTQLDRNDEQRNVELALRGKFSELRIECISADGLNANDCASYVLLGGTNDQVRSTLAGGQTGSQPGVLQYSDNAARFLLSQVLTQQVEDPLREKLRLDTVRIQFGVSSFDVQFCKRYLQFLRACGLAELGLLSTTARRYRAYGEMRLSDYVLGELSVDRLERSPEILEDTITRFRLQFGLRLPLHF